MSENNKYEKLKRIMIDYQEDYECDEVHKDGYWIKERNKNVKEFNEHCDSLSSQFQDALYEAENLGFVEGLSFALDLMMMTDKGENRVLVEKVRDILEFEKEE